MFRLIELTREQSDCETSKHSLVDEITYELSYEQ